MLLADPLGQLLQLSDAGSEVFEFFPGETSQRHGASSGTAQAVRYVRFGGMTDLVTYSRS
jgi:hypothetical protein